ncbi:TetR family transcriptional regulator C-terminal domain-containing protein [Parasedimentitalea psychrophila]|uniref:TetR family transcriptional regulator C-terminal domain-containing protein n=1 Tax=Parasedimentitalea psychrophila TaxID=2997337 RepID=A0A9Y2P6G6_9RHOB|nr:TetR family transcriptional regulator C-terminal domain-containing protein [Parasedimentitalea psychrophila]WIY27419.1 TetR family transcriptional regulator C-terminal domain-containing protein [Parasedimentitalea psychrophila]
MTKTDVPQNARDKKKSAHRGQLLDAAAEAIFQHGVRGATIKNIQQISGLSNGMINLHFKSKDNLLFAVAEELYNSYEANWQNAFASEDESPISRLRAIISADFAKGVLNKRNMAIWFAFRAEVNSHPEYRALVDSRNKPFRDSLIKICEEIIEEGQYQNADAILAANAFVALLEGMWTDFHLNPDQFDRQKAVDACMYIASGLFPKHF